MSNLPSPAPAINEQIKIFKNSRFGEVRVTEIEGKTYFVGSDVAKSLGYQNTSKALSDHCKGVTKRYILTNGGMQEMNVIPEGDIYRLAAKSELPGAEEFESWIFDEVLPSIRRMGGYMVTREADTPELIMARALQIAQITIENHKQRVQILEGEKEHLITEVKQLAPKAEYTDKVLQSTSTYTMTQVAKEVGMSAIALEKKLHDAGVMFKQSGRWMLYVKYQDKGYTKTRTHQYTHCDGTTGTNTITVWTEKGRAFVHHLTKGGAL
jgi:prophage antirepressor-like protein